MAAYSILLKYWVIVLQTAVSKFKKREGCLITFLLIKIKSCRFFPFSGLIKYGVYVNGVKVHITYHLQRLLHVTRIPLLTFHRLCVSVSISEVCSNAQGAAIGTGLDAGGLE